MDINPSKINILYLGRVSSEKGCDTIVRIANALNSDRFHFVFCGDGPELGAIKHSVEKNNLLGLFSFLGFIPHDKVPLVISLCDIGVVPSEYEELGLVILEMMAAKLPVISNDLSTVRQLIDNERTGLLVKKGDINSWIQAIQRLADDDSLREKIISNAFEKAKSLSSIDSVAEIVTTDIERACEK